MGAALPVYGFGPAFWRQESPEQPLQGGHAVAVVGYDDRAGALLLRNSWGADWGDQGHAWLPYDEFGHVIFFSRSSAPRKKWPGDARTNLQLRGGAATTR